MPCQTAVKPERHQDSKVAKSSTTGPILPQLSPSVFWIQLVARWYHIQIPPKTPVFSVPKNVILDFLQTKSPPLPKRRGFFQPVLFPFKSSSVASEKQRPIAGWIQWVVNSSPWQPFHIHRHLLSLTWLHRNEEKHSPKIVDGQLCSRNIRRNVKNNWTIQIWCEYWLLIAAQDFNSHTQVLNMEPEPDWRWWKACPVSARSLWTAYAATLEVSIGVWIPSTFFGSMGLCPSKIAWQDPSASNFEKV